MTGWILKRGSPSRRRDDDYDVLENGVVVGRIFTVPTGPSPLDVGERPLGRHGQASRTRLRADAGAGGVR